MILPLPNVVAKGSLKASGDRILLADTYLGQTIGPWLEAPKGVALVPCFRLP
jgi:hypothetical protein